jgi:hypothetical protein
VEIVGGGAPAFASKEIGCSTKFALQRTDNLT